MRPIQVTRVTHMLPFADVLMRAGVGYQACFRRWSLPVSLLDLGDNYLPDLQLLGAFWEAAAQAQIDDLGFAAFQEWQVNRLHPAVLGATRCGATLRKRLDRVSPLLSLECTDLSLEMVAEGADTRINCRMGRPTSCGESSAAWLHLALLLGVIRESAGRTWLPEEMTLRARYLPSPATIASLPNTRLICDRPRTSILVPTRLMDHPIRDGRSCPDEITPDNAARLLAPVCATDIGSRLKLVLPSYFGEAYPGIGLAAAICCVSIRTLQRELAQLGTSYSKLVEDIRMSGALGMLSRGGSKVIDVALSLGYADASHFARAFKRLTGVSPRQYRRTAPAHVFDSGSEWTAAVGSGP